MKAVMLSIQPKWCELIANGKKTVEVRKTRPKLETPFKCYIYCTANKNGVKDLLEIHGNDGKIRKANGKVIGEFMCYDIGEYETEFYPKGQKQVYEAIYQYNEDEEVWEPVLTNDTEQKTQFAKDTCLSFEDFYNYLGAGENKFYGLHISDLVIYDEPKELSQFWVYCDRCNKRPIACEFTYEESNENGYYSECKCDFKRPIKRPPQSWCYVEELV